MIYTHDCQRIYQQDLNLDKGQDVLSHMQGLRDTLPLFQLVDQEADLKILSSLAHEIRSHFTDVIILGTGGSSLGGQALCALSPHKSPRLHFHDNIDPHTFLNLFEEIDTHKTAVIAISKSGNTAETLMQLMVCLDHWSKNVGPDKLKDHFWIIAEDQTNGIREISQTYQLRCLEHPHNIGGRFAVFTLVGLLPAFIAGLDGHKVRQGARMVLDGLMKAQTIAESAPLHGAMIQYRLAEQGYTQSVLFPYLDRLRIFAFWYRQLWAESLGKHGRGTTPIQAMGTVDQHSQLQLYLDGPKDKFFTVITMDHGPEPFNLGSLSFAHPSLNIFKDKSMGQLLVAEQKATIDTLDNHGCPTRILHLSDLDEMTLGALMMHYVVETIAMAFLLDVNPFDQPAVEESKILARQYLTQMAV